MGNQKDKDLDNKTDNGGGLTNKEEKETDKSTNSLPLSPKDKKLWIQVFWLEILEKLKWG